MISGRIPRMPSWASLLTSTASARYSLCLRILPALRVVLGRPQPPSLFVVPQHRRSFVFKVLVKELSIRSIMIRWRYPFPWHNWVYQLVQQPEKGRIIPHGRATPILAARFSQLGAERPVSFSQR